MPVIRSAARRSALFGAAVAVAFAVSPSSQAQVCNLKVVTDAGPDYSDMESLIRSATSKWDSPEEKCWAMFYWNHIARRQTAPMIVHGVELTDPIRQFNDFGYAMCSTIAGINASIWHHMGMPVKFWDISLHTVSECEYGGRWHIYDNSMSAIYTLCDGVTIAGVEDVGRDGACAASDGRTEPGHIARYHCLNGTSTNGFLTGADTARDLEQEYRCFKPSGLKYRPYYNNWEWGHRYILNVREHEQYTRYYHSLGEEAKFYVPNGDKDPESANKRYRIRGNGVWEFEPDLSPAGFPNSGCTSKSVSVVSPAGLQPTVARVPGVAVFKIQAANVMTAIAVRAAFQRASSDDSASIAISNDNGLHWHDVWSAKQTGSVEMAQQWVDPVNGCYEALVRVTLQAAQTSSSVRLERLQIQTTTMLNTKTQPSLRLGGNEVYVGVGDQTDSIVFWPELQNGRYEQHVVEQKNVSNKREHPGYMGPLYATRPNEDALVVYRVDAPQPIRRLVYGGRFYNRARQAEIELSHSFDGGASWHVAYTLRETEMPWDDLHYETVDAVPENTRSVLLKYRWFANEAGANACSIYSVRMEVQHQPVSPGLRPVDITFRWKEIQPDRSCIARSQTQRVERFPTRYRIHVGGSDHPVMESLQVRCVSPAAPPVTREGPDTIDPGAQRFIDRWVAHGPNVLRGKPYHVSVAPTGQWGGSDPDGTKLTDGIVGPPYPGGVAPTFGGVWDTRSGQPEITVDIGTARSVAACCIHLTGGWPWWDALRGEIEDEVEAFTSNDGQTFQSRGKFQLNLWRKDIPINHLLPDEETACGWNYVLPFAEPVTARFVRFKISPKRAVAVTEVQALEWIEQRPFDMRIALPE